MRVCTGAALEVTRERRRAWAEEELSHVGVITASVSMAVVLSHYCHGGVSALAVNSRGVSLPPKPLKLATRVGLGFLLSPTTQTTTL